MDTEFAKKVDRETFEKFSKETQAVILQCFDHQKWLETEQEKLEYIYSLAKLYPIYLTHQNDLAEQAEAKIQRTFQTLVLEGGAAATKIPESTPRSAIRHDSSYAANGNGSSQNSSQNSAELSLEDDLELSLEGF